MGLFVGMDEAGYGPNLGPLVVTVTAWETEGDPRNIDMWKAFADVVDQTSSKNLQKVHIADSKQVYSPSRGMAALERAVLCALNLKGDYPAGFRELWQSLVADEKTTPDVEPWFDGADVRLPLTEHLAPFGEVVARWQKCCRQQGIMLKAIHSDIVLTERFNQLTRSYDSKGLALSRISMKLLRSVWNPDTAGPALVIADKHGGRNRYDHLLDEVLDGQMIIRKRESTPVSIYRVGDSEVHFQTKAESHFPVALASMVSKYVRELAMTLFNRYWCERVEGLKPTKGYPVDARRFRIDVAETQATLGIADDVFWRAR